MKTNSVFLKFNFKSKNPDRKEESCDESTAPMCESMFNRMIGEMEYLG